ncbi:MAG: (E)-4-hydroxy-3-methylbut-2-enyl-diphosphate synthase [Opitutales bacterium]|nr:(E)-4-hydroxy-3-methylbut-2-enyl-diphosphate synthase [Opitutales bacterium]
MYTVSRFSTIRRATREVVVGGQVGIGGKNPIRIQSMTTSNTLDVAGTVAQCIKLAEAGSELIRITAPTVAAAKALQEIHRQFFDAGFKVPLVADIHFLPAAAMEAIEHVEKVRINPGNYADKKTGAPKDYTDREYEEELERIHDSVAPLIRRAKELGRVLRIGTNHGSLSERTLHRFGDTPEGMVEAAMEFVRICEAENFYDIVLSMKSSNPKVMIAAYRLAVERMQAEGKNYPIHLGVTEAGWGEDARIKSAIGIGSLLIDGIGDTIRVSLTEDPWHELPVCRELIARVSHVQMLSKNSVPAASPVSDRAIDPMSYRRREIVEVALNNKIKIGASQPPRVFAFADVSKSLAEIIEDVRRANRPETPIEGIVLPIATESDLAAASLFQMELEGEIPAFIYDPVRDSVPELFRNFKPSKKSATYIQRRFNPANAEIVPEWVELCRQKNVGLVIDTTAAARGAVLPFLKSFPQEKLIFTTSRKTPGSHVVGGYRQLAQMLANAGIKSPIWIRCSERATILPFPKIPSAGNEAPLLEASLLAGPLLCDGIGDIVSVETAGTLPKNLELAYSILQGARSRQSRAEYIACPSCGRTLYNIQETVREIKARTQHLQNVTIGIMGCIVNGPGEMADADFGYVGGGPGKINLYVRKQCVEMGIPQEQAVDKLIALIKAHGRWTEPPV